jgi:hypothetical protein
MILGRRRAQSGLEHTVESGKIRDAERKAIAKNNERRTATDFQVQGTVVASPGRDDAEGGC